MVLRISFVVAILVLVYCCIGQTKALLLFLLPTTTISSSSRGRIRCSSKNHPGWCFSSSSSSSSMVRATTTTNNNDDNDNGNDDDILSIVTYDTVMMKYKMDIARRKVWKISCSSMTTLISSFVFGETGHSVQTAIISPGEAMSGSKEEEQLYESITVPLKLSRWGKDYLIYYRIDGSLFRAVLDTGSPFLMIPGSCSNNTKAKSGCYKKQGIPSGYDSTYEQFDGFEGPVEWRSAPFSFVNATGSMMGPSQLIFGVASESIMSGPGGVFFGLIRDTDPWIRPSFLGQTNVKSFQINLSKTSTPTLTLSTSDMLSSSSSSSLSSLSSSSSLLLSPTLEQNTDYIPMVNDLRTRYGDPVNHYTAIATSVHANGVSVLPSKDNKKKKENIYVIFDTGVTGMLVSQDLFNERYIQARERREKNLWGEVHVSFETAQGKRMVLPAWKPLTTVFDPQKTWKRFRGHLIVLGLSFLDGNKLTIDIDGQKLWIEPS